MKPLLIVALLAFSGAAKADQVFDLTNEEVQAANFLLQCAHLVSGKDLKVTGGTRGTFLPGLSYSFVLADSSGEVSALAIRWTKATRKYDCAIQKLQ